MSSTTPTAAKSAPGKGSPDMPRHRSGRVRILLVDDNPDSLISLEATLEGLADELVLAQSGSDALRHVLADDDFAAILLDVKMPGMDGFEAAELIRSRKRNRNTPILFLTGYRGDAQLFRGYDLGAVDFLFKPIVPEILRSKVSVFVELARREQLLRMQAETLSRAEVKFRSLLEAAPDATVITDQAGNIVLVNTSTVDLFGYAKPFLLATNIRTLVPDWPFAVTDDATSPVLAPFGDIEGRKQDGSTFPAELSFSPLQTEEGLLITTVVRDITERKRAEAEIRRVNSELEQRVNERTAELTRSNGALRQFAWAASHDLQEPLRMVITFTELLSRQMKALTEEERGLFRVIQDSGVRMHLLLGAIREYMQVSEAGQSRKVPVDCELVFEQALANLSETIRVAHAEITHDPLPTIWGVEVLMLQIFQNLLANAIKYRSDAPPRIHISVKPSDQEWLFQVSDNGIGIDPRYHHRIFGVFRRLHPNKVSGTGIGLAICQTAAESMGGRIWVESKAGEGATFCFTIPRSISAQNSPEVP